MLSEREIRDEKERLVGEILTLIKGSKLDVVQDRIDVADTVLEEMEKEA